MYEQQLNDNTLIIRAVHNTISQGSLTRSQQSVLIYCLIIP